MDLFKKCREYYPYIRDKKVTGFYPYFRAIDSEPDRRVVIQGKSLLMLGSNNYLGLTTHPKVKEAAVAAVRKYGTGCTGSRFMNGTLDLHEELEHKLAAFLHKQDCICFPTGYQTNLGVISSLVNRGEYVVTDKLDHASIIDGCRLSFGKVKRYVHNDMASLEHAMQSLEGSSAALIISDGIFSMDGDIVKLPKLIETAHRHHARVMIDDAHSVGVLGRHGAGTGEHFGLEDKIDLIMGTFSKSFATIGGFVVGDADVITYIRHHARSLMFSASIPGSAAATALAALEVIKAEPERREQLWRSTERMLSGLKRMGYRIGTAETPIIPLIIGDLTKTINFWHDLFEAGVFTNPVVPPAVPPNGSLIRTSYIATHTDADIDEALDILERIGRKRGIIP